MFSKRSEKEELMDNLHCSGEVVIQTLRELEFINKWLGGNHVTLNALNKCLKESHFSAGSVKIADIGCGGGDLLIQIAHMVKRRKLSADLIGVDANPFIIDYARNNTSHIPNIRYQQHDVLVPSFYQEKYDIVNCTLFCHHLDDNVLEKFLRNLKSQTTTVIIINDIHRHWLAYHAIKWLTILFSKSDMVKYDAKLSVLRAFKKEELEAIIKRAGFTNFSIKWKWAFRFEVIIRL